MTVSQQGACVVGLGARTPIGLSAAATAAAVRAGVAGMRRHEFLVDRQGTPIVVAMDTKLSVDVVGTERLLALAVPAAIEALAPLLENDRLSPPAISVLVALPEERPGWKKDTALDFGKRLELQLRTMVSIRELSCTTSGHAGGLACLRRAVARIDSGRCDVCLVGGVDSYMEPKILQWLDQREQLHSEATIWGFCPGEAASFCLVTSSACARRLGLSGRIKLLSVGASVEANRINTESVCIGHGLSEAFRETLLGLPLPNDRVDQTICDMNGDPYRGNEFGFAVLRTSKCFAPGSDFAAPADCWGDVGAASGPLFVNLAAFAAVKGYAEGPLTLLWASSEGGLRAAALVHASSNDN